MVDCFGGHSDSANICYEYELLYELLAALVNLHCLN